jgi:hypothetical protein
VAVDWSEPFALTLDGFRPTVTLEAVPGFTVMPLSEPLSELTESVAVIDWEPALFRVTEKLAVPEGKVESTGSEACGSELVKCTVPE